MNALISQALQGAHAMEAHDNSPLVSIVIPTYNYADYLPTAIASCLQQTYRNIEIIVVDDGSTDNTPAVVEGFRDRVRSIRQANQGVSSARNRGLEEARGSFITFLDADDSLTTDSIEMRVRVLTENDDAGFVISSTLSKHAPDETPYLHDETGQSFFSERLYEDLLCRRISFATCAVLMRTDVARTFSFPTHISNGEDIVYFTKVFFRRKGYFLSTPTAITFSHPDSLRHNIEQLKRQGIDFVTAIIDDPYYKGALDHLRKDLLSNRYMELFRRYYAAGEKVLARECYRKGIRTNPRKLSRIDYLVKFIKTYF
ncbi:MAG TPA: glycosyltransferase family 2 protein [Syntrophorhabdaceae bacterium]|nr:glycosyltransferase family 2 protein [Syntrophorhabdaceae bacterium]